MFEDEILLIIGNGFDIDLGLKTRYSDFIKSEYYPVKEEIPFDYGYTTIKEYSLLQYLKSSSSDSNWIGIEASLLEYINIKTSVDQEEIEGTNSYRKIKYLADKNNIQKDFETLRQSLISYLNSISFDNINRSSTAARLLDLFANKIVTILSYNYTDLNKIMNKLGLKTRSFIQVHGKLEDKSIIIGVQDDVEIPDNANFIIKSHSEYYRSCAVRDKLEEANHIIFFGHSLGETDYHYFRDFFRKQSGLLEEKPKRKKITIFTYDEKSRLDILSQLRRMNEKRVNYLFDLNDVEIFRTGCPEDKKYIDNFLEKMRVGFKPAALSFI